MKVSEFVSSKVANGPHAEHWHDGLELQIESFDPDKLLALGIDKHPWARRVPKVKDGSISDNDDSMPYPGDLIQRAGTSGWNWRKLESEFVILDIDASEGHAAGLDDQNLAEAIESAKRLPYVQIHYSKSGRGVHLYVRLAKPVKSPTRRDHRQVALAIIERMKADGFDASKVDCKGTIGWLWDADAAPNGFQLIGERARESVTLPENWRETLPQRPRLPGIERSGPNVELDKYHNALIDWLLAHGWAAIEDDHDGGPILRTHTRGLSDAFADLKLPGVFQTLSDGSDPRKPNCYAFPLPKGRWIVYRYNGAKEAPTWRTENGNTVCNFGIPETLERAAEILDVEEGTRGYVFADPALAEQAARIVGGELRFPAEWAARSISVERGTKGRYIARMAKLDSDPGTVKGWELNKKAWERLIGREYDPAQEQAEYREARVDSVKSEFDNRFRYAAYAGGKNGGWFMNTQGEWIEQTKDNCHSALMSDGFSGSDAKAELGTAVKAYWTLIDLPFQPEYPEGRKWNLFGAQYRHKPSEPGKPLHHPHFDMVLDHCGEYLTPAVLLDRTGWCKRHKIKSGADWLRLYIASAIRFPYRNLPYLFFFGPQNCGKSSYHEMIGELINKGYRKVDKAFTRGTTFSGEFAGTIIAVIEEADLTQFPEKAYGTIKDVTTAKQITIERKGWDSYDSPNTLHLIHTSNKLLACPILEADDTRVVAIKVDPLAGAEIKKEEMAKHWEAEAPDFLRTLLDLPLPPDAADRLYLPVLNTPLKCDIIDAFQETQKLDPAARPDAIIAHELLPTLERFAERHAAERWPVGEIHAYLKQAGTPGLPETVNQFGSVLNHAIELMGARGLTVDKGESNRGSWATLAHPRTLAFKRLFTSAVCDLN